MGMTGTALQYNSLALSCLGFVSQLSLATKELLCRESSVLQGLTRSPYNTFSRNALVNMHKLGFPVSFKSVRATNHAAMFRAATYTSNIFMRALARYKCAKDSDELILRDLPSNYFGIFETPPIVCLLENVVEHIGMPGYVRNAVRLAETEYNAHQKSRTAKGSIQKRLYEIYRDFTVPFVPRAYFARRMARWKKEWCYLPEPHILAERALNMIRHVFKRPIPCITSAIVKTLLNGWITGRRMRSCDARRCRFGCVSADDSIEHYAVCAAVHVAWEDFAGLPHPNGPLGFLCLAQESSSIVKLRMAFIYCLHSVVERLRATTLENAGAVVDDIVPRMRERKRHIAGMSSEVRRALIDVKRNRQRNIDASWPQL